MIRIRVKGRPDRIEGFLIWGHARYAPYGRDVVCAGVSAVATTALMWLVRRFPGDVRWAMLPQGLMYCRVSGGIQGDGAREAQAILEAMVLGLDEIRQKHTNSIDLAFRR